MSLQDVILQIKQLKAQGLSNQQIILLLQKKYDAHVVLDAFNQLNLSYDIYNTSTSSSQTKNISGGSKMNDPFQTNPVNTLNAPVSRGVGASTDPGAFEASNEEIIETIIEEKWNELIKHINKIITWKNKTEEKILKLEENVKDLSHQFDELHRAIIGKIGEYDQNILNVGAEVKAMEKVFSKVLPVFIENVKELSNITEKFKVVSKSKK